MNRSKDYYQAIDRATTLLQDAGRVLVFAGSGLSAESGVPTFRGPDGYYLDARIESYTHVNTFDQKPQEVLAWYQDRRDQLKQIHPNAGHYALAEMTQTARYTVATQNVDFLFEKACQKLGIDAEIWHLHGSLLDIKCHDCGAIFADEHFDLRQPTPCSQCGGRLRPGVVWFGESLPENALETSIKAAQNADVCLLLGTSAMVYPAAYLPEEARRLGASLIEINPRPTAMSDYCNVVIRDKTGHALPLLAAGLKR